MRYTNAQYTLFISRHCNLSCPYCFAKNVLRDKARDLLSLKDIRKLVNFIFAGETEHQKSFTIVGGEPSLHPEFIDIIEYLLSEGFNLRIFTNGIWPRKNIDYLLSLDDSSRRKIGFLVNYNHDIREKQTDSLDQFCTQVLPHFASTLGINIHRVDERHLSAVDLSARYNINSLRIGIAQPIGGQEVYVRFQDYPKLGEWIFKVMQHAVDKKVMLFMDCSHPYCLFNEEQHQYISTLLSNRQLASYNANCAPPLVIGPGLQSWRCFNDFDISENKTIHDFQDVTELENYYGSKLNHWNIGRFPDATCHDCRHRLENSCHAGCAGFVLADNDAMLSYIDEYIAPRIRSCVLALNGDFFDDGCKEKRSFSVVYFGKRYRFDNKPYWDILQSLDGKTAFGELLRARNVELDTDQLAIIIQMIKAKILTVVSVGVLDK